MIWNFGKGEVIKGFDAQLYLPLMPPCSPLTLDDVEDFTATFYTTIDSSAITKELSDFTVSGVMGTIVLQAVELEALDDGVIRYTTHFTVRETGLEQGYEFISNYFLKTPVPYEPIDFVTTAEVNEAVAEAIETSTAITEMVQEAIAQSGAITSGDCQSQIETAMAAETARTEETYLKEHQSLADYYTSAQTNEAITQAIDAETARTEQTYLKEHQSLADYYTSAQTNEAISTAIESQSATTSAQTEELISQAMAAETARTEQTYLKEHQSLADYYTSAQTDQAISSALTNSGFITSGDCQSQIETAMTDVVTSETIKVIWKGSQAQYDAMSGHSNNTLYIIV